MNKSSIWGQGLKQAFFYPPPPPPSGLKVAKKCKDRKKLLFLINIFPVSCIHLLHHNDMSCDLSLDQVCCLNSVLVFRCQSNSRDIS